MHMNPGFPLIFAPKTILRDNQAALVALGLKVDAATQLQNAAKHLRFLYLDPPKRHITEGTDIYRWRRIAENLAVEVGLRVHHITDPDVWPIVLERPSAPGVPEQQQWVCPF